MIDEDTLVTAAQNCYRIDDDGNMFRQRDVYVSFMKHVTSKRNAILDLIIIAGVAFHGYLAICYLGG